MEEQKQQLEKDIQDLTRTASELTLQIQNNRKELDELVLVKDQFLKKRQEEELLLLEETLQKLAHAKEQFNIFLEAKKRGQNELQIERESLQKEQQNLVVLQEQIRHALEHAQSTSEEANKTFTEATKMRDKAKELQEKAQEQLEIEERELEMAKGIRRRDEEKRKELEEYERKLLRMAEELGNKRRLTNIQIKDANDKLTLAQRIRNEAEKLITWHKESKKL